MKNLKFILLCWVIVLLTLSCSSRDQDFSIDWPTKKIRKIARHQSGSHDGMDIATPIGTPVYSAHSGVVIAAQSSSSYGKYIILEFSNKWATLYAHLSQLLVKRGDSIQKKQKIGLSGASGQSHGSHLHFELLKKKQPVDPMDYLK